MMRDSRINHHVPIPLSDGVKLSAKIWFPTVSVARPVILEIHPYPKRYATALRDEMAHGWFAQNGYVAIRVDLRGSGESEGIMTDEYTAQERADITEVINWIANQEWCTGKVGMFGLSWGAYNSLQLASNPPEALACVAVAGGTDDRYSEDLHYVGGVMISENVGWAATLLSFLTRPIDPEILGAKSKQLWLDRLEALTVPLEEWLKHPTRDSFWTDGFASAAPNGLTIPTLAAAGNADVFGSSVWRMCYRQPDTVKIVIGPWAHKFPYMGAPGPTIDWLGLCKRWFDRWLDGDQNGAENDPVIRAYVTDSFTPSASSNFEHSGRWLAQNTPTKPLYNTFFLGKNSSLVMKSTSGEVLINTPVTHGVTGGEFMPMGWGDDLPADQSDDDALAVTFDGEPLEKSFEIWGEPEITLQISTESRSGYVVARLCDVAPDGKSTRLAIGALNLTSREGFEEVTPARPDQNYSVCFPLSTVFHSLKVGHKLRLAISNTYWPSLWPQIKPAKLILNLQDSFVKLPMLPSNLNIVDLGEGQHAETGPRKTIAEAKFSRVYEQTPTGPSFTVKDRSDEIIDMTTGLITWSETIRSYGFIAGDLEKPKMEILRDISVRRGDWHAQTSVSGIVYSTFDGFKWMLTIKAIENEVEIANRILSGEAKYEIS